MPIRTAIGRIIADYLLVIDFPTDAEPAVASKPISGT
jgi:hypothetical protein